MQFHVEQLEGDRPVPPRGCPGKMGTPCPRKLQRRGGHWRHRTADSEDREAFSACFRCPLSGRCFSVIPEGMLPYRPLSAEQAGAYADQQSQCSEGPQETVVAEGRAQRRSWQSFWLAFSSHAMILAGIFGIDLASAPAEVWKSLRGRGESRRRIGAILVELHAHQTSLVKNYLSHKPWWQGGLARGP